VSMLAHHQDCHSNVFCLDTVLHAILSLVIKHVFALYTPSWLFLSVMLAVQTFSRMEYP
jgi:hypothetical protein